MKLTFIKRDNRGNEIGVKVDMLPSATEGNFEAVRRWYTKRGFVEVKRGRRNTQVSRKTAGKAAGARISR